MTALIDRLVHEEDGTCMTDARGMYGWLAAIGVAVYFMYGHRWPELVSYIDHVLPPPATYTLR
jgi:hypothetical protein